MQNNTQNHLTKITTDKKLIEEYKINSSLISLQEYGLLNICL